MPEEIEDFEEVESPVARTTKNTSSKDNIIDFKSRKQGLKANNTPNQNISDMPKKTLDTPPKTNNLQNQTPKPEKSNVLPFDRNKKKLNNDLKQNKTNNNSKKDNVLPFGKNKNNERKKNNDKNNPLKDKLGKKKNPLPFGRRTTNKDDNDTKDDENKNVEASNDNKSEDKNKLGKKKDGIGSKLDKLRHPGQTIKNGVKDAAQAAVKKILKPIKIKLMTSAAALVGGLALCFFVIYLILSPLIDIWPVIDETARAGANFTEKFLNFFKGFGFEDSKTAFYNEAESLNKWYNNSLDMPLLLSTLFYPETQDYNMDYEEHLTLDNSDPITETLSGGPAEFVNFLTGWVKDVLTVETTTTFDENGLAYNANKIYRLRRLAAAMADREHGEEVKDEPILTFMAKLGSMLFTALTNVLTSVAGGIIGTIENIASLLVSATMDLVKGVLTFNFSGMASDLKKDFENCLQGVKDAGGNIFLAIKQLINILAFGFCTITDISFNIVDGIFEGDLSKTITVSYRKYGFNKEQYDAYLMDYYFENTYEYSQMLPKDKDARAAKKRQILTEIYETKKTFEELFMNQTEGTAEEYVDNCEGAIKNDIVKNLSLPIKATEGTTYNLGQNELFGIRDGYKQNGVILTSSNSGISEGDEVYSVYDGKVIEVHRSTDKEDGTSIGGRTGVSSGNGSYKTYSLTEEELQNIASQCHAEQGGSGIDGVKAEASLMANLFEYQGSSERTLYTYVRDGNPGGHSWFANSKRHMNTICKDPHSHEDLCCYTTSSGNKKCITYYYTEEELAAVKDVLVNGNRTLPVYVDEHDNLGDITKLVVNGVPHTDRSYINNKSNYISGNTVIYNRYGSVYTFYTFPASGSDPFGYKSTTYNHYKNNEVTEVEQSSNYVTIEHEMRIESPATNTTNVEKFYTIYKYLGSIPDTLKVGDTVTKGQVIGTIGKVYGYNQASLYFEFQNRDNEAVNPNNLFIKCAGGYSDYIWPCSDGYISDFFGDRSYEVRNGLGSYGSCATTAHVALDIAETGAFYAIGNGTIASISKTGVHTIELKLDDTDSEGNDIYIIYTHGDAKSGLKEGQRMKKGEQIGTANGWGSDGPGTYDIHLHFGVYTKSGNTKIYRNPLTFLYNLKYDSTNDWKMSVSIPKYDGSILSEIKFWNIRAEERNFASENATIGAYNKSKCDYENPKFWKTGYNL